MNLFELFIKVGVDDQASGKLGDLSSKLGNGLKTAAKIGTAAVTAAATGLAALTTAAVNNYAEYEQLIGGVETLFKGSADAVQQYAENAYKTAGLSANEYMSTVTGFSASLLQSLGGDTEKAAKYADTAIISMSDNANKMGTSMELIQNAYQGFAKQNYTMLDNLKLGYGGTKEEMQRLLEDAEKLEGFAAGSLDITKFSDIVYAIDIVQDHMGIAGATAAEAGTTIEGSVNSMKAAWENLLTGLSDGNADIESLVNNLVSSIVGDGTETNLGVLGNIMPAVKTALSGVSKLISELLPPIVEEIPTIINENLPVLAMAAVGIVQSLVDGISANQEMLFETIFNVVTFLAQSFISMLPQIIQLGLDLIISLAQGIAESLPELVPTIIEVILKIVEILTNPDSVSSLVGAALEIMLAIAVGLIKAIPELIKSVPKIIASLVQSFVSLPSKFAKVGKDAIQGLWNGLKQKWEQVKSWFSNAWDNLVGGVENFLGINSPSKLFAGIGASMAEGVALGWDKEYNGIRKNIEEGLSFNEGKIGFDASAMGQNNSGLQRALKESISVMGEGATIIVQSVLDGRIIGETAYKYSKSKARAYGV